jgi:ribosome-associated protein
MLPLLPKATGATYLSSEHFSHIALSSLAMDFQIPDAEISFRATRSGGPGGQHVNQTSTRVEVRWQVTTSPSLTEAQRESLLEKLSSRIDSRGFIRVVAEERRSQLRNREAAVARLNELVRAALIRPKPRKKTKPSAAARRKRLEAKRKRSIQKQQRRPVERDE